MRSISTGEQGEIVFVDLSRALFSLPSLSKLTCTSLPLGEKVVSEKEYCFLSYFWKRGRVFSDECSDQSSDDPRIDL